MVPAIQTWLPPFLFCEAHRLIGTKEQLAVLVAAGQIQRNPVLDRIRPRDFFSTNALSRRLESVWQRQQSRQLGTDAVMHGGCRLPRSDREMALPIQAAHCALLRSVQMQSDHRNARRLPGNNRRSRPTPEGDRQGPRKQLLAYSRSGPIDPWAHALPMRSPQAGFSLESELNGSSATPGKRRRIQGPLV